jgi:hypothetical protein
MIRIFPDSSPLKCTNRKEYAPPCSQGIQGGDLSYRDRRFCSFSYYEDR